MNEFIIMATKSKSLFLFLFCLFSFCCSCSNFDLLCSVSESLDRLFLAAPFMDHFEGEDLLAVHTALDRLYVAFTTPVPDGQDPKLPIYPDDIQEIEWTVKRKNCPNWSVIWSHISRSKLRPMSPADIGDTTSPPALFDVVQITPGAIVYCHNKLDGHPAHGVEAFLTQRFVCLFSFFVTHKSINQLTNDQFLTERKLTKF